LSRDCNHPELAAAAVAGVVGAVPVSCASQGEPTPWYEVRVVEREAERVQPEEKAEEKREEKQEAGARWPEAWLRGELF
jgi:hypothetical protein